MIIANPLFDLSFKRILENNREAKYLMSTILGCEVVSLIPSITERTTEKKILAASLYGGRIFQL
jgi:hypothetical protein